MPSAEVDATEEYGDELLVYESEDLVDLASYFTLLDADDALQEQIAYDSGEPSQESQALEASFASSFTSSFGTTKRLRQSISPPSYSEPSRSSDVGNGIPQEGQDGAKRKGKV